MWIAALRQLADHNVAQLYRALWQSLDLDDPADAPFQAFVLATLDALYDQPPGEILAALIRNAPTPDLRRRALQLLAEASQELSVKAFRAALDDPNPSIRESGLKLFDELNLGTLLDSVDEAAQDRDQAVRLAALSTLEEMSGFSPVWEVAERLLDDADPKVRLRALELLTYGDQQAAIDQLVLALEDPDPVISERAEALLAELEQGS
jgi:HEAT repeat protein